MTNDQKGDRTIAERFADDAAKALNDNTAFERHQEAGLADDSVARLREEIERSGVEFLYYMLPTLGSRTVAKMVPAKHFVRNLEKGISFHRTALTDLQSNIFGHLIGGGVEAKEFVGLPEPESFQRLPWDHSVGRIFCSAYEPPHLPEVGGQPLDLDARAHLRRMHEILKQVTGYELRSGTEPEMVWTGPGLDPVVKDGQSPAYQVENLEVMRPVYQQIVRYATELGFDMIEGDYEDKGQLELNWMFDGAEKTADRLVIYRQICKQVAREQGLEASFMPKPYIGSMGNGCHHNLSLWDAEGRNVLVDPERTELHLSERGLHAVGGILEHAAGMMLVMASTVNSYKRFWDPGQFAPARANWGLDDRSSLVRISSIGRAEFRVPDASVNPYLSHSVLIAAIVEGLSKQADPGPAVRSAAQGAESPVLPLTLGEAIEAFRRDELIQGSLPPDLARVLLELKEDEWARYCGAVTEWEFQQYWQAIP